MEKSIEKIKTLLSSSKTIVITTHLRPDGDAIGSSLGLHHYLKEIGYDSIVITPTDYSKNLHWLPGDEEILIGTEQPEKARELFLTADLIFCLDFNDSIRVGQFQEELLASTAKKVLLDHHTHPKHFEDIFFADETAASTTEMVYRLIRDMGDLDKLTPEIAMALYLGTVTDTGSFRFNSVTPDIHIMVAELLKTGIEVQRIHEKVMGDYREERLKLIGHCYLHCLHVYPEYHAAYFLISREVCQRFNMQMGDTEGLVNSALNIEGVKLGILVVEREDLIKISIRSRGDFPANAFAGNFNGGGHFHAAGGRSHESLEATEEKLLGLLSQYKEQLLTA